MQYKINRLIASALWAAVILFFASKDVDIIVSKDYKIKVNDNRK